MAGQVLGGQLHLTVLSPEKIQNIHTATLDILEQTGLFIETPLACEMLRGAGARVTGQRVKIPAFLVEKALQTVPHRIVIADRDGKECLVLEGNRTYFHGVADHGHILDPFTHRRREFTSDDYRMTAKVIDACPNLWGAHATGNAKDYPPEVRVQASFKHSIVNMRKPFVCASNNARQLSDVIDMAAVVAGGLDKLRAAPFIIVNSEPTSPLGLFNAAVEKLFLAAREGLPLAWYPANSAGTTAPCTPAATLAIGNAEVLAGLVLHQLARPGAPFIYGQMPGMTDMGPSMLYSYGSPDLALHLAAATDLAHSYGLPMYGTAGCSDAHSISEQAASEATVLCMMAKLSGANIVHDAGYMGSNTMISPEMLVLTNEILGLVDHVTRQIDTRSEEFALELIDRVGPRGNFVTSEHTLTNFRRFWYSTLFPRRRPGNPLEDPLEVKERINQRTRNIIEKHQVEPLPTDVLRELDELEKRWLSSAGMVKSAKRE